MRLIAASPSFLLLFAGIHAQASVPAHVHELCLKAADYPGCVRAQQGSPVVREKESNNESKKLGNICPNGYAYIADDLCQKVYCDAVQSPLAVKGNDPIIGGKSDWKCGLSWSGMRGELRLGAVGKLRYSSACPPGPPVVGWNSTCEAGGRRGDSYRR